MTDILFETKKLGLPPRFSPGLLLAIALAEGARAPQGDEWNNLRYDGLFQVTSASGCQNPLLYNDTHEGFIRNVDDAICTVKTAYNFVIGGGHSNNYNEAFSSVPDWPIVLTVLHYNVTSDPIYAYRRGFGNPQYLSSVAGKIDEVPEVSSDFGCLFQIDSHLKNDLLQGQGIVTDLISTWQEP